jgi:class 3 adenylate cyclase
VDLRISVVRPGVGLGQAQDAWASRIAAKAEAGEILVADVVRELVAGKEFLFNDRGDTELRGFEDPVRVYEVRWRES